MSRAKYYLSKLRLCNKAHKNNLQGQRETFGNCSKKAQYLESIKHVMYGKCLMAKPTAPPSTEIKKHIYTHMIFVHARIN